MGLFGPWAPWGWGLAGLGEFFRSHRRRRRRRRSPPMGPYGPTMGPYGPKMDPKSHRIIKSICKCNLLVTASKNT